MAKLIGRAAATAVTEDLTTLIDWVNIQQADTFELIVQNVGGGSADDVTDVQVDSSSDGGTTMDDDDDDGGISVPLSTGVAKGTFAKSDLTYNNWVRIRAKCGAGNDTTVAVWLVATTTSNKTLDELSDEARSLCGVGSDTELVTETVAYSFVDRTQREIARRVPGLYDLHVEATGEIALVTNTKAYSLAGFTYPVCHLYRVRLVDTSEAISPVTLENMSFDDYRSDYPYPEQSTTGKPAYYVRVGSSIYVEPIPSSAYTTLPLYIDYGKWPARLTTSTDEPDIRDADELLVAGTMMRIYRAYGHGYREQAKESAGDFEQMLEDWTEQQVTLLDLVPQMYDSSSDLEP